MTRFDPSADRVTGYATRSMLVAPMREHAGAPIRGVIQVLNKVDAGAFDDEDEKYLVALATQLARALALTTLRAADAAEPGLVLRGPLNRIVGRSEALREVYERVLLAAQTDATVLLRRRDRHGQGSLRPRYPRQLEASERALRDGGLHDAAGAARRERALRSRARRFHGRRPTRRRQGRARGGRARSSSTRSATCRSTSRASSCASSKSACSSASADARRSAPTFASCARRTAISARSRATASFREDLFYRVRVVEIVLPPLRARGEAEVLKLAEHFADMYATRYGRPTPTIAKDALAALLAHDLPGNVRELEHWIESAIVLSPSGVIRASAFPSREGAPRALQTSTPTVDIALGLSLEEAERHYARACVVSHGGNKTEAARALGIGRNTLARLLKE